MATRGMRLPDMGEEKLSAARRIDHNIIDATREQKWHQILVHGVDLQRYGRESDGMKSIQREIEEGADRMTLAGTPRWLLLLMTMESIPADPKK